MPPTEELCCNTNFTILKTLKNLQVWSHPASQDQQANKVLRFFAGKYDLSSRNKLTRYMYIIINIKSDYNAYMQNTLTNIQLHNNSCINGYYGVKQLNIENWYL